MFNNSFHTLMMGAALLAQSQAKIQSDPASRQIVDEFGRSVIFHGVNVVYKMDPYIPSDGAFDAQDSLNDEDI